MEGDVFEDLFIIPPTFTTTDGGSSNKWNLKIQFPAQRTEKRKESDFSFRFLVRFHEGANSDMDTLRDRTSPFQETVLVTSVKRLPPFFQMFLILVEKMSNLCSCLSWMNTSTAQRSAEVCLLTRKALIFQVNGKCYHLLSFEYLCQHLWCSSSLQRCLIGFTSGFLAGPVKNIHNCPPDPPVFSWLCVQSHCLVRWQTFSLICRTKAWQKAPSSQLHLRADHRMLHC